MLVGEISLGFARSLKPADPDIAHYTHYHPVVKGELEVPAQRILVRPIAACEGLADHRDELPIDRVGLADVPAQHEWNFESREKPRRGVTHTDRMSRGALHHLAVDVHRPNAAAP